MVNCMYGVEEDARSESILLTFQPFNPTKCFVWLVFLALTLEQDLMVNHQKFIILHFARLSVSRLRANDYGGL